MLPLQKHKQLLNTDSYLINYEIPGVEGIVILDF